MIPNGFEKPTAPKLERRADARYPTFHSCDQCGEMEVDLVCVEHIAGTSEGNFWTGTSLCEECVQKLLDLFPEE